MDAGQYRHFQSRLRDDGLLAPNSVAGWATVLVDGVGFGLIVLGLERGPGWAYPLLEALLGLSMFRWFVIMHECGHGTLFASRRLNTAMGYLASLPCMIPYVPWRDTHALHHLWTGVVDKDPTQRGLLALTEATAARDRVFRLVWALWLPLPFLGFLWDVYWLYPLGRRRADDRDGAVKGAASVALCAAVLLAVILILGVARWAAMFLPAYLVFLVIIENVTVPQHAEFAPYSSQTRPQPVPYAEQDAITRSTRLPDWAAAVLSLNFVHHTEHHLFPAAPWFALGRVRQALLAQGYAPPHQAAFPGFMVGYRRRDPLDIYRESLFRSPPGV